MIRKKTPRGTTMVAVQSNCVSLLDYFPLSPNDPFEFVQQLFDRPRRGFFFLLIMPKVKLIKSSGKNIRR